MNVVLPAPLWPRKPNAEPRGTARLSSLTATRSPKYFVTRVHSMMCDGMVGTLRRRARRVVGRDGDVALRRAIHLPALSPPHGGDRWPSARVGGRRAGLDEADPVCEHDRLHAVTQAELHQHV